MTTRRWLTLLTILMVFVIFGVLLGGWGAALVMAVYSVIPMAWCWLAWSYS